MIENVSKSSSMNSASRIGFDSSVIRERNNAAEKKYERDLLLAPIGDPVVNPGDQYAANIVALLDNYFKTVLEYNQTSADKAYERNKEEAAVQRAWTKYMSDTSYQRAVADMKKAGLNPMLLVSRGFSGASNSSGSAASAQSASAQQPNLSSLASILASIITGDFQLKTQEAKNMASVLNAIIGMYNVNI